VTVIVFSLAELEISGLTTRRISWFLSLWRNWFFCPYLRLPSNRSYVKSCMS